MQMKLLVAIIQPAKLEAVRQALQRIGITRLTVTDALGFARQKGQSEVYRGSEYQTHLRQKVVVEIAVNDDFLESAIECVTRVARTGSEGSIGDGKIFVLPMEDAIQIGGTARGPSAI